MPLGTPDCFTVFPPRTRETPVVVEAPHAGLLFDAQALAFVIAPARSFAKDADLYVDELVSLVPNAGATLLVAHTSRYFIDLNRGESDHDGCAVEGSRGTEAPHGVIWHRTTDERPVLNAPLPYRELERRLALVHRPYHHLLEHLLAEKKARFGYAILLCTHSMPSVGKGVEGRHQVRADVVPGTRGRTTAARAVIDCVTQEAQRQALSIRHDDPYRGGFSTATYGNPYQHIHAIQVEIARRLYMDEATLTRVEPGFAHVRAFLHQLAVQLGALQPHNLL